jgi:hypothetical protein
LALIIVDLIVGDRKTRALVSIIDVPVGGSAFCDGTLSNYIF